MSDFVQLSEKAWGHISAGKLDLALQLLTRPIGETPEGDKPKGYADALAMFAYCSAVVTKKRKESINLVRRSLKIDTMNVRNFFLAGKVYEACGPKKMAVEHFQKGLKLQPNYQPILQAMKRMGTRKKPVLPFLHRSNALNIALGKLRHIVRGGQ